MFRALTKQHEVGPQCRSEEANASYDRFIVVENSDVGSGTQLFEFLYGARDAAAVELVVPGNIENRRVEVRRPRGGDVGTADISGQNDQVGTRLGAFERPHAKMQVGEDIEYHAALAVSKMRDTSGDCVAVSESLRCDDVCITCNTVNPFMSNNFRMPTARAWHAG